MQLLDPLNPVQSTIIGILSKNTELSIQALHRVLRKENNVQISLPHLYKMVARMIDGQMIVKMRGKLSLNMVWIFNTASLLDTIRTTYVTSIETRSLFPKKTGRHQVHIHGNCLAEFAPTLSHILLQGVTISGATEIYTYAEFPWYSLGLPEEMERLTTALHYRQVHRKYIYAHRTPVIERLVRQQNERKKGSAGIVRKSLVEPNRYLNVIGEYIVEYTIPPSIRRYLDVFIRTSKQRHDTEQGFRPILEMKGRITVSITHDAKAAHVLRTQLQESLR